MQYIGTAKHSKNDHVMAKKNRTNRLFVSAKQALHERPISSEIENREDAQASLRLKEFRSVSAHPELAKKTFL